MLKKLSLSVFAALVAVTPAFANEKVTVLLDWYVNPDHAPVLVAQSIGAFKDAGLDVEIIPPADPSTPPRLLAAKQADLAISYQPQLYFFAEEGLPLVRIGTLIDTPLNTIIALPTSGIKTIADLKGRKIGHSSAGLEEATLQTMLKSSGLTLDDVTRINVNFQLAGSLMSGQVDAVIGGYRNIEANELRENGIEPVIFNVEDYGIPAYDELIVLAHKDDLGAPKLRKFMDALKKGTDYLLAHPDETWTSFAKAYPELDNALNKAAWKETLPLFARDPRVLDKARYVAYGQFMLDAKLSTKVFPLETYTTEFK